MLIASRHHGSTISGWQQNHRRRRRKENGKKKVIGFYWQNNKFARASRYFVQFFAVVAPLRHETSYFHTLASWSRWTQHKSCLFLLIILDTVLSDSTRGNFSNICQIKDRWSLKRCEKSTFTLVPGSILMNQYPFYNFLSYFVIFFLSFFINNLKSFVIHNFKGHNISLSRCAPLLSFQYTM